MNRPLVYCKLCPGEHQHTALRPCAELRRILRPLGQRLPRMAQQAGKAAANGGTR